MSKKWIPIYLFAPVAIFIFFLWLGNTAFAIAGSSSAPTITSAYATSVGSTRAVLNGSINPNGASSTAWFHFGGPISSPIQVQNMGSGTFPVSLNSYVLTGLTPSTSYSFRIEASNQNGNSNGNWVYFTTLSSTSGNPAVINNNTWNSNTWNNNNANSNWNSSVWNTQGNANHSIAVVTSDADNITDISGTLHGSVNPTNYLATGWFEYGTIAAMGKFQSTTPVPINPSTIAVPLSSDVIGLTPETTYYFRTVGKNYAGAITKGNILSFVTKKTIVPEAPLVAPTTPPVTQKEVSIKKDVTTDFLNKERLQKGFEKSLATEKANISSSLLGWAIVVVIVLAIAYVFAKVRSKRRHKYGLKRK